MIRHDSQRGWFAYELYHWMEKNPNIFLICLDLGYKIFDEHFKAFPERCINPGAAEQAGMGVAVGLAMEGKIPFVYSITPFLLYRPFETIRNYINKEKIPVRLVGAGLEKDYLHDGFSHWAEDVDEILKVFKNISRLYPKNKEDVPHMFKLMMESKRPIFIGLRRSS